MQPLDRRRFVGATAAGAMALRAAGDESDQAAVARSRPPAATPDLGADPLGIDANVEVTADAVQRALGRGIAYLKGQQQPDGTWPDLRHYDGGLTPLCTLALLNAGCEADDEAVALALNHLRYVEPRSTYTTSLQTMAFCAARPEKDLALIARNAEWLQGKQILSGPERGMWSISGKGSTDHVDNSMTHFAMLALHEAARAGIEIPSRTWELAQEHWRTTQNDDGSWGWGPTHPGWGSMTSAGIAALVIAGGMVDTRDAAIRGERIVGCGPQRTDKTLDRAWEWLEAHFSVQHNPGTEFWHSYYLYALERAARMTARRFIGGHDWYREGARVLLQTQQPLGAWPEDLEFQPVADRIVSTSFSLMFLSKGRWPIVMAHWKREPLDDWNRHRGALGNLISHLEVAWKRNLAHQAIDVAQAYVDDLLESPVAFLNGREAPRLTPEERAKLRQYIDAGGFLFAERCCGGHGFDEGFRHLMKEVFPEEDRQLRLLEPDHPVWLAEEAIDPRYVVPLWGIDVSCRTGVIYCPTDLSCCWEIDRLGRPPGGVPAVRAALRAARSVGLNVLTYATGRNVAFKNPAVLVPEAQIADDAEVRGQLRIANVRHNGGSQAAPSAVRNLLKAAAQELQAAVAREPGEVSLGDDELFRYHLLYFHGRSGFVLTPDERQRLRSFVERGGTVLANAVCSSSAFTEAFRREMVETFPDSPLRRLAPDDPLFTPAFGGANVTRVERRAPHKVQRGQRAAPATIQTTPEFEVVEVNERYGVLFSPYDLSCALDAEPIGCDGYTRTDALALALNVVLYSLM